MLHFSNWKISGILLVVFAGILFSLPNFMSENTRLSMPEFLPSSQLNLGLDLQGKANIAHKLLYAFAGDGIRINLQKQMRPALHIQPQI